MSLEDLKTAITQAAGAPLSEGAERVVDEWAKHRDLEAHSDALRQVVEWAQKWVRPGTGAEVEAWEVAALQDEFTSQGFRGAMARAVDAVGGDKELAEQVAAAFTPLCARGNPSS